MALRSQTRALIATLLLAFTAAQAADFPVTHVHLRRDEPGKLSIGADGVRYTETKVPKKGELHDFFWDWTEIQKLTLTPERIEIQTYEDAKWLLNRDRVFTFKGEDLDAAYPLLRDNLPRRFVPEIALETAPDAKLLARRLESRNKGYTGALLFAQDRLVFRSDTPAGSHTWIWDEVDNISSTDPLQLTVSSLGTDYRFQLREPLSNDLYNRLWRKLNTQRSHR